MNENEDQCRSVCERSDTLWIPSKARNVVACIATIRFSGITLIILLGLTKYKDDKGVCV